MRELNAAVLAELRTVQKARSIKQKDIQEWSTGEIEARGSEIKVFLPELRVWVCYLPRKGGKLIQGR